LILNKPFKLLLNIIMRNLVKKLDAASRLAPALLARAPSFKAAAGALADEVNQVMLSNGETVHLHLPSHTHLNPGDILLDSMGMMVRVDAAAQPVLALRHANAQALVGLALAATKQGRAIGWEGDALLLAQDHALGHYLNDAGFGVTQQLGTLNMPLAALPQPEHACGHEAHGGHQHTNAHTHSQDHSHSHDAHTHDHDHGQGHDHSHAALPHVHGPNCKH
jgi:urease accessory protein